MARGTSHLPQARVVHFTPRRLRLRLPDKRGDAVFFESVRQLLSGWDSIEGVEVNPLTGSVLALFSDPLALFADNTAKNTLFAVDYDELYAAAEPTANLTDRAARNFAEADAAVRRWTAGAADLRGLLFLLLLGGGLYQLGRGNIAAPAATLLWYAGATLRLWDVVAPGPPTGAAVQAAAAEG